MSFQRTRERSRDLQDEVERHVWGEQKYISVGSIIRVRGTDTEDKEAVVLNIGGVSFNLPKDSNTEVFLDSSSSDTTLKMAILTIPRDKQRAWMENTGGIQHPTDAEFCLEFNGTRAQITKAKFAVGETGEFEVKGEEVYARVKKFIVDGELVVNKKVITPEVVAGSQKIPDFENPAKQAPREKEEGTGGGQS